MRALVVGFIAVLSAACGPRDGERTSPMAPDSPPIDRSLALPDPNAYKSTLAVRGGTMWTSFTTEMAVEINRRDRLLGRAPSFPLEELGIPRQIDHRLHGHRVGRLRADVDDLRVRK
jgi:hypothetical protein